MAKKRAFCTFWLPLSYILQWPLCFCRSRSWCSDLSIWCSGSFSSVEPTLCVLRGALPPGGPAGQMKVFLPPEPVSSTLAGSRSAFSSLWGQSGFSALFLSRPRPLFPLPLTFSKISFITLPSILPVTPLSCLHSLFFLKWLFTHGSLYTGQTSQLTQEALQLLPTLAVQPNSGQCTSCPQELSRKLL